MGSAGSPCADNTVIVFTSDHGEMGGPHLLKTKLSLDEEAVAVPLIVCPPRPAAAAFAPGVDRTHLVSALDLFPSPVRFRRRADPGQSERSQRATRRRARRGSDEPGAA